MWPFKKNYLERGAPTEQEILQATTYLQWRTSLKIAAIVDDTRVAQGHLPYDKFGFWFQGYFYPRLRELVRETLLIESDVTKLSDEDIAATDDERLNIRENLGRLLRRGAVPVYKRNPRGVMQRDETSDKTASRGLWIPV